MITTITRQVVNGTLKLVQTVVYADGKTVKRIIDPKTGLPTDILPDSPSA
jgi:hypothetical protein